MTAQNVTMGKFRLNQAQIAMLGRRDESYQWEDEGEGAIGQTADSMANNGFSPLAMRGDYFVASTSDNDDTSEHIGQYRIKFHYNVCGTATIMAQQLQDNEDVYTFRKWNPEKKTVPYG